MRKFLAVIVLASCLAANALAQEYIWLEGQEPTTSDYNEHGWYSYDDVRVDWFSPGEPEVTDGDWHTHYRGHNDDPGTAAWEFTVTEGGEYTWWIRLSARQVRYLYRLNDGDWEEIDVRDAFEYINLIPPGIDIRFMGWVKVGTFELEPGEHTVEVRIDRYPGGQTHGGIDAMCFANFEWYPAGALKPDEGPEPGPDVWFPLRTGRDAFSPDSIIDMQGLLDESTGVPAGKYGHVQRVGSNFELSERPGVPVKFWGANVSRPSNPDNFPQQARFYAKHGVNVMRRHYMHAELGEDRSPERQDLYDRWFAALKDNGVYTHWSVYYPDSRGVSRDFLPDELDPDFEALLGRIGVTLDDLWDELEPREDGHGRQIGGFTNFVQAYQQGQWEWLKPLLEHENPYTGMRYVDDPALAFMEVQNEDCLFWHWPLNALADGHDYPNHTLLLRRMWFEWLQERYADDDELEAAWGDGMRANDSVETFHSDMKMYGAWELEEDGPWGGNKVAERARMGDYIRFLAETQRHHWETRFQQVRDLGFQGVLLSTAWKSGGPAGVAANMWADDAGDAITRHAYMGGGAGGHDVQVGEVRNVTHLDRPGRGIIGGESIDAGGQPVTIIQVEDKPAMMTEWNMNPPNQWRAEISPLYAFYGMGLQGWDSSLHFAGSRPWMGSGWPGAGRGPRSYVTETPVYMGQFPALAFAIHKGHIQQADAAAARRLSVEDLFRGIDPLSQPLPDGGFPGEDNIFVPPEVTAIGRVSFKADEALSSSDSERVDWSEYWDESAQVITSMTGELVWDYGNEVVQVKSPKTQGIIGFAGGGTYDLPGVQVEVHTEFVSLLFTPLDDRPLIESDHILITAMAQDKQVGTEYNEDGTELLKLGGPPLLLEPVQANITFGGPALESVRAVDVFGVPTDQEVTLNSNSFTIDGNYQTYYYEVRREVTPTWTLQIDAPEGEGVTEPEPGAHTYDVGEDAEVTATPEEGWEFSHWLLDGDEAGTEESITVPSGDENQTRTLQAVFEHEVVPGTWTLHIVAAEGEGATDPPAGYHRYDVEEDAVVTATPEEGWEFSHWLLDGDEAGTEESITVPSGDENQTRTLQAIFTEIVPPSWTLQILVAEGEGATDPEFGDHTYEVEQSALVTATPVEGWLFSHWLLDGTEVGREKSVTIPSGAEDETQTLQAVFILAVPSDHLVWGLDDDNQIWVRTNVTEANPDGGEWLAVPGTLAQVDAGVKSVWGVDPEGNVLMREGISRENARGTDWVEVPGQLAMVTVGEPHMVWALNQEGQILVRTGIDEETPEGTAWDMLDDGAFKHISVGFGAVWAVDAEGRVFCRLGITPQTPTGTDWSEIAEAWRHASPSIILFLRLRARWAEVAEPLELDYVSAGDLGLVWGLDEEGAIFTRRGITEGNPPGTRWESVDGQLVQVSVGFNQAWGVRYDGNVFRRAGVSTGQPGGTTWHQLPDTTLRQVALGTALTLEEARGGSGPLAMSTEQDTVDGGLSTLDLRPLAVDEEEEEDASDVAPPADGSAPTVTVQFPTPEMLVEEDLLTVRGTASDESVIRGIWVNGIRAVATADNYSNWEATIPLNQGRSVDDEMALNEIIVIAADEHGNVAAPAARLHVSSVGPAGAMLRVSLDSAYHGCLVEGDVDTFQFEAAAGTELRLELDGQAAATASVELLDPWGRAIEPLELGAGDEPETLRLAATGLYTLRVLAGAEEGQFRLWIDGSLPAATGQSASTLGGPDDRDVYAFGAVGGSVLAARAEAEGWTPVLEVLDPAGRPVTPDAVVGGFPGRTILSGLTLPETGDYRLRVTAEGDPEEPYSLVWKASPPAQEKQRIQGPVLLDVRPQEVSPGSALSLTVVGVHQDLGAPAIRFGDQWLKPQAASLRDGRGTLEVRVPPDAPAGTVPVHVLHWGEDTNSIEVTVSE